MILFNENCSVLLVLSLFVAASHGTSVIKKIMDDPDLSEFYARFERSKKANISLSYKEATIFAPINAAFQKFERQIDDPDVLILYHISTVAKKIDQLGSSLTSINSELIGNPPLWITHTSDAYHNDIYINNARLLISSSNILGMENDNLQVLHKIDEVLVPTRSPSTISNPIYNPTAFEFLTYYESLIVHPHRLRSYRQSVEASGKNDIFKVEGGHTFFMPVDEGFKNQRAMLIDGKIIDGHVIPNQVLFTSPTKKDTPFQTLANTDNIKVVITFTQESRGKNQIINYVKSHTLVGDGKHTQGVVLAEIVTPNIPVKNGVIHLIHKPLMVVDNTVRKLLEEKDGGILNNFVKAINTAGLQNDDFYRTLESSHDVTLFAPCNNAWNDDLTLSSLIGDQQRFRDILNMHLVVDNRLYVDKIMKNNQNRVYQTQTLNKRKNLYFNVVQSGNNRTITVEGGGVNATILQADLAATNGIIHIIDRVLGVPYTTVFDKLRTDPMLQQTYMLGNRKGFNHQLNDTTKKFTYFVPRDKAWADAKITLPSAIKKLFMPEFAYHANSILERHLVIDDIAYTMEVIKLKSNVTDNNFYGTSQQKREVELPSIRGKLRLYVEERHDHTFIIHWNGEKIPVVRPNVECTNGVIHVIDAPFIKEGDIQVTGRATTFDLCQPLLIILTAKLLLL